MVRRPGSSPYDAIGLQDMTTDDTYYERGINLLHGYLAERYVDDHRYIVPLPDSLREVGVLLEPTTVAEKGLNQAWEIQRRLKIWQPAARRRASAPGRSACSRRCSCGCAGSRSSATRAARGRTATAS